MNDWMRRGLSGAIIALLLLMVQAAATHEVRPAYLEITETAPGKIDVLWKQPVRGDLILRLVPRLSSGWLDAQPDYLHAEPGYLIKRWHLTAQPGNPLEGQTVAIEGLEQSITDVLVSVTSHDGQSIREILKPQNPALTLQFRHSSSLKAPVYLVLGVEHILIGIDHLLFVLGLMLLVQGGWRLVKTITAFTIAHSITLAATALDLVQVPSALIEALVALSIAFLAVELVHAYRGKTGLTMRYPWLIAATFGLLHGFAFAGALAEIGLPRNDIPLALFLFNVGVEIGQILFIVAALSVIWVLSRLPRQFPAWARWLPPYAIGSFAAFWFIERMIVVAS